MPTYYQPIRVAHQRLQLTGIIYVLMLLLLILGRFGQLSLLRRGIESWVGLFSPIRTGLANLVSQPQKFYTLYTSSDSQIMDLQRRNAELKAQLGELQSLKSDYLALKSMVENTEVKSEQSDQASIRVARVFPTGKELWIDQGKKDGIQPEDLVFYQGILIGQITTVSESFAKVITIDAGELNLQAKTSVGSTATLGVVEGGHEGIWLNHLVSDAPIKVGDLVFTAGSVNQAIPKGLVIGEVKEIAEIPESPTKRARIEPGFNLWTLEVVEVRSLKKRE